MFTDKQEQLAKLEEELKESQQFLSQTEVEDKTQLFGNLEDIFDKCTLEVKVILENNLNQDLNTQNSLMKVQNELLRGCMLLIAKKQNFKIQDTEISFNQNKVKEIKSQVKNKFLIRYNLQTLMVAFNICQLVFSLITIIMTAIILQYGVSLYDLGNFFQEPEGYKFITDTIIQQSRIQQLLTQPQKYIETTLFNGTVDQVVMGATEGKYIYIEDNKNLLQYTQELQLVDNITLGYQLWAGIQIKEKLYCSYGDGTHSCAVQIFNTSSLQNGSLRIKTTNVVYKFFEIQENFLFLGESWSCIEILKLSDNTIINTYFLENEELSTAAIVDILLFDQQTSEYAVATSNGLVFMNILFENGNFTYVWSKQVYFTKSRVFGIEKINQTLLAVGYTNKPRCYFVVFDRQLNTTKQYGLFMGDFHVLQKTIGYDKQSFPFILIKERSAITVFNTQTFISKSTPCNYNDGNSSSSIQKFATNSLVQIQYQNMLRIYTICDNTLSQFNISSSSY